MENTNTKPWYQSTGIQGGIVAALGFILNILSVHYHFSPISSEALTQSVSDVLQVVGIIMGIYGRFTATQQIG